MVTVNVGPDKYDVWVDCGDERLEEWALTCQGRKQECWIASQEGKEFRIVVKSSSVLVQHSRCEVFVDGIRVCRSAQEAGQKHSVRTSYIRVSKTEVLPLMFTNIRVQETNESLDSDTLKHLAIIRVVFKQVQGLKSIPRSERTYVRHALPAENALDEKSKKAGMHGARLGDPVQNKIQGGTYYRSEVVPGTPTYSKLGLATQSDSWLMGREAVAFHYAPADYLRLRDLMPEPQRQGCALETAPDSLRRGMNTASPHASSSVVTARARREPTGFKVQSRDLSSQDDRKPPHTAIHPTKRTIQDVGIDKSDNSDVDELSLEDQLAYARIRARLATIRETKVKKRVKLEGARAAPPEEVIYLSD